MRKLDTVLVLLVTKIRTPSFRTTKKAFYKRLVQAMAADWDIARGVKRGRANEGVVVCHGSIPRHHVTPRHSGVRGHSSVVEKTYVRSTKAPVASDVRPETVLRKSVELCMQKSADQIALMSDQLRSIRQDLTIQRIESTLTAYVYECNVRVAILCNDRAQLGQCLNHARLLHRRGIHGGSEEESFPLANHAIKPLSAGDPRIEIAAYVLVAAGLGQKADDELNREVLWLERSGGRQLEVPIIKFAIQAISVRENAMSFIHLARTAPAPLLSRILLMFIPELRFRWLKMLLDGSRGFIPTSMLRLILGFDADRAVDEFFVPLLGGLFNNGFIVERCKLKLERHVDSLVQQRW